MSLPVARELLVRKATPRPARWSAVSVSPAPEMRVEPCQTQPSRSTTKPRQSPSTGSVARRAAKVVDGLPVHLLGPLGDRRPGELRLDAPAAGPAHLASERGVGEDAADGLGERVGP